MQNDHNPANQPETGDWRLTTSAHRRKGARQERYSEQVRSFTPVNHTHLYPESPLLYRIGHRLPIGIALWSH